jgi:hypothetical protein
MTVLTKPFTGALAKKPEAGTDDDKLLIKVNILFFSVADPGSDAFLPLDPGWVESQHPDPG